MRYGVVLEAEAVSTADGQRYVDPFALERFLDRVLEAILDLDAEDATMSAALVAGRFELSLTVEADEFEEAVLAGRAVVGRAIHVVNGQPPDWALDWISAKATKLEAFSTPAPSR